MEVLNFMVVFSILPSVSFCEQKIYYLAVEEFAWDYAASGENLVSNDQSSVGRHLKVKHIFRKYGYKEYTDGTFSIRKEHPGYLGFLGPVLRADVGDELVVVFKNNVSRDISIHPHGIAYDKNNEGSAYGDQSGVASGTIHRYMWNITEDSGPGTGSGCVSHMYHSDVDFIRDVNSGLVGFILVCAGNEEPPPYEDIFLFLGLTDESLSWLYEGNDSSKNKTVMHAINGYVYGNMPNLTVCIGDKTRFHVASLTSVDDVHSVRLSGHSFTYKGKRYDALPIFSGASITAEITPTEPGTWLFSSTSADHIEGGMQTLVTVQDCGSSKPIVTVSSKVKQYFISAEEVIWNGRNRTMFLGYTGREFDKKISTEKYIGALGPLIKARVGDLLKIVFYNKLNTTLSIKPTGLRTSKFYEGQLYNDSSVDKVRTAPGEKRTYYWFVPEYLGPAAGEDLCIPRYYTTDSSRVHMLIGPLLICHQYALDDNDDRITGEKDLFLFLLQGNSDFKDINGFERENFPELSFCTDEIHHIHLSTFTTHPETILSTGDPFEYDGSRVSTVGLVPFLPISVKLSYAREGFYAIENFPSGNVGLTTNVKDCGPGHISNARYNETSDVTFIGITDVRRWFYDNRQIGTTTWKAQQAGKWKMSPRYQKMMYAQYFQNFARPDSSRRLPYQGYLGHIFYTSVGDLLKIVLRNYENRNFTLFAPGVISDFDDVIHPNGIVNVTWKIPKTVGPGSGDAECIAKTYYSNVDAEKDITTGLVGPMIICRNGTNPNMFQHTIIFFGEIDETKSWYLTQNVGSTSDVDFDDPDFINNNRINVINGYSNGTIPDILLQVQKQQFLHLFNIGFRFQSVHIPGILLPSTNNHFTGRDVIGMHPGTSFTFKVAPKVVGKWQLVGLQTNSHWNKISAILNVPSSTGGGN